MKKLLLLLLCCSAIHVFGQVGINPSGSNPDASAGIDVDFTDKGALIPRLTTVQRDAISNPAVGLHIFNVTTNCFNFWTGTSWKQVCGECDFPNPVAGSNAPVCEGANLLLSVSSVPGATYNWSGPGGFSSSSQSPVISNSTTADGGLYSVTVTLNGCTSSPASTVVTINTTPATPVITSNSPVCSGNTINVGATSTPGASFSWSGPAVFTSNIPNASVPSATEVNEGTYYATATLNGCVSDLGSAAVIVNTTPASSFSPFTAVTGAAQTFTPSASGISYAWTFPSGSPATSSDESPGVTWIGAGTYSVSLTATDNGCSSTTASDVVVTDPTVLTYDYTGSQQSFTVPSGVSSVTLECWGASGGNSSSNGGKGGYAKGTLAVSPGNVLYIYVGGMGTNIGNSEVGGAGYNGGGNSQGTSGGGGGASDVRFAAVAFGNRVIVAGGGGGGRNSGQGGDGGGLTGSNGLNGNVGSPGGGGGGATQSSGGVGGSPGNGQAGTLGQGGQGGNVSGIGYAGGGGGGYYGGGGGGGEITWGNGGGGGGGGGSSYVGGVTNTTTTAGVQVGHGQVKITY